MNYLWDTNICVFILRGHSHPIEDRLRTVNPNSIYTCSVVRAELVFGSFRSSHPEENLIRVKRLLNRFKSVPFDDQAADVYGEIRAQLTGQGLIIGPNDLMIAATALVHGLTLVTHNTREFERVKGLLIEDWTK